MHALTTPIRAIYGTNPDPVWIEPLKNGEMTDYLQRILRARVYDVARKPLWILPQSEPPPNNTVWLKREDLQPVFSFKLRTLTTMAQLSADELKRGVIASSAGNHAQGVALSAQRLGCRAVIVMPSTTPR